MFVLNRKTWLIALAAIVFPFTGCTDEEGNPVTPTEVLNGLGWFGTENYNELESDIQLAQVDPGTLPASVDLMPYMPPVGDQGQYGTCVAWAAGYGLRTYLGGRANGLNASQLASASNQFSPKDLFWAIPSDQKGEDCNGTYFEAALDVMLNRGVARHATVPYTGLGNCSNTPDASWTQEAGNFRIENYRKIDVEVSASNSVTDVINSLKMYLSQGRAILFGAKLGDGFMGWNSSDVITSDGPMNGGQHGYHAMMLVGYDNSKGPNGAFRVYNSWDDNWGDAGLIWVDYNFFVSDFVFTAFVARVPGSDPDPNGDGQIDPQNQTTGLDLVAWEVVDQEGTNGGTNRSITYNVYNTGDGPVAASEDWSIVYVAYNAYDADDYVIILQDVYSNDAGQLGDNGPTENFSSNPEYNLGVADNWFNHVDVDGGSSVAEAVFGDGTPNFSWQFNLPTTLNGQYYFVLIADGFDDIPNEADEENNFLFANSQDPVTVVNGVVSGTIGKYHSTSFGFPRMGLQPTRANRASPNPSLVTVHNRNTYSPREIAGMLRHEMRTGQLEARVREQLARQPRGSAAVRRMGR